MTLQASRQRFNREGSERNLESARCSVCHGPIAGDDWHVVTRRNLRVCERCWKDEEWT